MTTRLFNGIGGQRWRIGEAQPSVRCTAVLCRSCPNNRSVHIAKIDGSTIGFNGEHFLENLWIQPVVGQPIDLKPLNSHLHRVRNSRWGRFRKEITLEPKLYLMKLAGCLRELVVLGNVVADKAKGTYPDLAPCLLQALSYQSLVNRLPVRLTTTGQHEPVARLITTFDCENSAIGNDDRLDAEPDRIHQLPNALCRHNGSGAEPPPKAGVLTRFFGHPSVNHQALARS
jgi:hypothetical protein